MHRRLDEARRPGALSSQARRPQSRATGARDRHSAATGRRRRPSPPDRRFRCCRKRYKPSRWRTRQRIDRLLVERGLFESRAKAQAAIAAGLVTADDVPVAQAVGRDCGRRGAARRARPSVGVARRREARGRARSFRASIPPVASASMSAPRPAASPRCCSRAARGASTRSMSGAGSCIRRLRGRPEIVSLEDTDIRELDPARLRRAARASSPSTSASSRSSSCCRRRSRCAEPRSSSSALDQAAIRGRRSAISRRGSCAIRPCTPTVCDDIAAFVARSAGRWSASFPRPIRAATAITNSSSARSAADRRGGLSRGLSLATASAMVPRHDIAGNHDSRAAMPRHQRAVWRAEIVETVKLALPIALTQLGQIAMMTTDLALIGRLGDERGRGGRARAPDPVLRLRARHGPRIGRCAVGGAGIRRAQTSHGAPLAAGGTLGGGDARRPGQRGAALGRATC